MTFQFFRGPRHAQNNGKHNVLEDSWTLLGISSDRIYDLLHLHMFLNYRSQDAVIERTLYNEDAPGRFGAILSNSD